MIREIVKFVTNDGTEHYTRTAAEIYEAKSKMVEHMETSGDLYFGREDSSSPEEIIEWLLAHYDITPKPEKP